MNEHKKNALIVGATSDMGTALYSDLVKHDFNCLVTGQEQSDPEFYLNQKDNSHKYIQLDILNSKSIDAFITKASGLMFDWVVYFPGVIDKNERSRLSDKQYISDAFAVNATFPAYLAEVLKDSVSDKGGIIFISSTAGIDPNGFFPIYSSSKAALNAFAVSLGKYWADEEKSARVYALCPGPTNTKMRQEIAGDAAKHQSPENVASLIQKIIKNPEKYPETIYTIRDGELS